MSAGISLSNSDDAAPASGPGTGGSERPRRIKRVIVDSLHLDDLRPGEIGDDEPLFGTEGLGLDSVDALELVVALEKEFGVRIDDDDLDKRALSSVSSLSHLIESLETGAG